MALIHHDILEDLPEKSAGRAALSSVDLVDMVGGGAEGCYGEGWVGGTGGVIRGWLGGMRVLWEDWMQGLLGEFYEIEGRIFFWGWEQH